MVCQCQWILVCLLTSVATLSDCHLPLPSVFARVKISQDLLYEVTWDRSEGSYLEVVGEAPLATPTCPLSFQNGLPSPSKSYVFNGDFVDRGKQSLEILIVLFTFLLIYPKEVHLNRGNHEDHMVNLRYGARLGLWW